MRQVDRSTRNMVLKSIGLYTGTARSMWPTWPGHALYVREHVAHLQTRTKDQKAKASVRIHKRPQRRDRGGLEADQRDTMERDTVERDAVERDPMESDPVEQDLGGVVEPTPRLSFFLPLSSSKAPSLVSLSARPFPS